MLADAEESEAQGATILYPCATIPGFRDDIPGDQSVRDVVSAVTLLGLRELVAELGGDIDLYAREVGLDLASISRPEQFVSSRKVHDLANLASLRLKPKDLGLLWGARSDPTRLGALYVALLNAETGREAFEIIVRYLHINFPTGSVTLKVLLRTASSSSSAYEALCPALRRWCSSTNAAWFQFMYC